MTPEMINAYESGGEFGIDQLNGTQVPKKPVKGPVPHFINPQYDKDGNLRPGTRMYVTPPGGNAGGAPVAMQQPGSVGGVVQQQAGEAQQGAGIVDQQQGDVSEFDIALMTLGPKVDPENITEDQRSFLLDLADRNPGLYDQIIEKIVGKQGDSSKKKPLAGTRKAPANQQPAWLGAVPPVPWYSDPNNTLAQGVDLGQINNTIVNDVIPGLANVAAAGRKFPYKAVKKGVELATYPWMKWSGPNYDAYQR